MAKLCNLRARLGGFINISHAAKKVVFVGTFNAGKLEVNIKDGRPQFLQDGLCQKFVDAVENRTFGGRYAYERHQPATVCSAHLPESIGARSSPCSSPLTRLIGSLL
jgi:acyl CoA:acetate/3-ketoacid CoA transferase